MQIKDSRKQHGNSVDPVENFINILFVPKPGESRNLLAKVQEQVKILDLAVTMLVSSDDVVQATRGEKTN